MNVFQQLLNIASKMKDRYSVEFEFESEYFVHFVESGRGVVAMP